MDYEVEAAGAGAAAGEGGALPATMHDVAPLETQDSWARFW